ncbi:oligosaccharide flippase family protein [Pontibacter sp. Tf4]|uniref:lipopolysaccharide biosynthesis protein n=1 Tax=Pontibacter sp. Tf4 TaxID=2761620 RepID=UPI0016272807|nr:oligosaccharide flippase family protein [Pontibacter sp. Tf4]MBB6611238.1 oligosaccharide flippase family protein [Pontibacter sp. Tf4]
MLRKLFTHAVIYGLAAQAPKLAGVLTLPIITRYLTSADYGVAGVVTAYMSVFTLLQSLGLSVVLVNSFAKQPTRFGWIWRQLNGFVTLWSVVYGLVAIVALYYLVPDEGAAYRLEIALLCGLPIMFYQMTEMQSNIHWQLSQRAVPLAVRSFIVGALIVALNVFTIAYLKMGFRGWFYATFIGNTAGFLLNGHYLYFKLKLWPIFRFRWHRIVHSLKLSLPMVPHNAAMFLLDASDKLVLDVLRVPIQRIGLYNIASNFGTYFMLATGAIMQASSPFYMKYLAQERTREAALQVRRFTFLLLGMFLFATTLGCLWMREIFILLIKNEALQQAYPLAIIILMGYNFRPMYMVVVNTLIYREQTTRIWHLSVVAGVANLVLNFMLVPIFGYQAAAYTTFASLMYLGYAGFYMQAYKATAQVPYYPMAWLALTVLLLFIVYYLADASIQVKIIITALTGAVAIVIALFYRKQLQL